MRSTTYIMASLDELIAKFTGIKCSYKFDADSNTHLIEILPNTTYALSKEYAVAEEDIMFNFMSCFPTEGICFITDTSLIKMEDPSYVIVGAKYNVADAESWFVFTKRNALGHSLSEAIIHSDPIEVDAGEYSYAMAA